MVGPENCKSNLFIHACACLCIQTLFGFTRNCITTLQVVHYELLSKSSGPKSCPDHALCYCDSRPAAVLYVTLYIPSSYRQF